MILQTPSFAVDALLEYSARLPSVEDLRPPSCPGCGRLAWGGGDGQLGLVGHGTYERQVLGLLSAPTRPLVIRVRRFKCVECSRTTSVLPDLLYPGRWYGAWVILEAVLLTVLGQAAGWIRRLFSDDDVDTPGWRSLRRWRRELCWRLWGWEAPGVGVTGPCGPQETRRRLVPLLARAGVLGAGEEPREGAGALAGPRLLRGRVHERGRSWVFGHGASR